MTYQNDKNSQSSDNTAFELSVPLNSDQAILNYDPNHFEDFFTNVLTRYRTRKIPIYKVFSVNSQKISNFCKEITRFLEEENKNVEFQALLYFKDEPTPITFTDIDKLKKYADGATEEKVNNHHLVCNKLSLYWDIDEHNNSQSNKQKILLLFDLSNEIHESSVNLEIQYTDVQWKKIVEKKIEDSLKPFFLQPHPLIKNILYFYRLIPIIPSLMVGLFALEVCHFFTSQRLISIIDESKNIPDFDEKLLFLKAPLNQNQDIFSLVMGLNALIYGVSFVIFIVIWIFLYDSLNYFSHYYKTSFILLTETSRSEQIHLKNKSSRNFLFCIGLLLLTITSLVGYLVMFFIL